MAKQCQTTRRPLTADAQVPADKRVEDVFHALKELSACGTVEKANSWFAEHSRKQFPGFGARSISVPPCYHCKCEEYCTAPDGKAASKCQESDKKGDLAHIQVHLAFMLLNDELERKGQPNMFIMSGVHADNILAWLRQGDAITRGKDIQEVLQKVKGIVSVPTILQGRNAPDLLVLHKDRIVFVEVKGVGLDSTPGSDDVVKQTVKKAKKQLETGSKLFHEIMNKDEALSSKVIRVIALPGVARKDLPEEEGFEFLCRDDLLEYNIKVPEAETNLEPFRLWWDALANFRIQSTSLHEIAGKYIGLLSTPVVPKEGNKLHFIRYLSESINKIQCRFQMEILTEQQKKALEDNQDKRRVYLKGPGGSGKTLMLIEKARTCVDAGNHVIVVNMNRGASGLCIGKYVYDRLCGDQSKSPNVHEILVDLAEIKEFSQEVNKILPQHINPEHVLFLADEVHVSSFWSGILETLNSEFQQSTVWCAGFFSEKPDSFEEIALDTVIRCPPAVQRLLYHVDWKQDRKSCYASAPSWQARVLTHGPLPICVRHERHQTGSIIGCRDCAQELVQLLKKCAPVVFHSKTPRQSSAPVASKKKVPTPTSSTSVALLVNIPLELYTDYEGDGNFKDIAKEKYEEYIKRIQNSGFVETLRQNGIEVKVDTQLAGKNLHTDEVRQAQVLVTWLYNFLGLESGITIFLPGDPCPSGSQVREETDLSAAREGARDLGRDIPAPGVNSRSATSGAADVPGASSYVSYTTATATAPTGEELLLSELYWQLRDIRRYSDWDKTNILVAGSRCTSQFILLVP